MGEASDKTEFDWIIWNAENDRDRRRRGFGRKGRTHITWRGDHVDPMANQIGCQFRKAISAIFRPARLDCYILPFDIAGFAQAVPECSHETLHRSRRAWMQESNGWYHLFRARR